MFLSTLEQLQDLKESDVELVLQVWQIGLDDFLLRVLLLILDSDFLIQFKRLLESKKG